MTTGSIWQRGVRIAAAALLALTVAVTGCGRPPDEAWLQFIGFKQDGKTISVVEGNLRDESAVTVDAEFENGSLIVGQKNGTGVLVNRARIDYQMSGFAPPSAEYPLNLYLSPPADGKATIGTLTAFPLVPLSLKSWLIATGAFEDSAVKPFVELNARVTFFGETDEGTKLETEGSVGIALTNTGVTGAKVTVNVFFKSNAAKPSTSGSFLVFMTRSLAADITVYFSTAGTAVPDTDYVNLGGAVTIPAGLDSAAITIIPKPGGTPVDTTVKITLSGSSAYTLGTHITDTLTISHD